MYKVISANRSSKREPKNWRIFEKEAVEKHYNQAIYQVLQDSLLRRRICEYIDS